MANIKISDLTAAAAATGTQEFEVNDSLTSKKVTGAQILAYVEGEVSSSPSFTGQVSIDDGSASAPSLTNTGDSNTGLYFPAADTVAISTGGTKRLEVDSSGTTTLTGNQVISVTDNTNAALRITQLGTGNALVVEDSTNPDSTPFIVDASGNVGIGTASPAYKLTASAGGGDGASLHVSGTTSYLALGSFLAGTNGAARVAYDRSTGSILFSNGLSDSSQTERMRIDGSGNVGIGSTSFFDGSRVEISSVGRGNNVNVMTLVAAGSGAVNQIVFRNANGAVGSIQTNVSTTTYATSSDYRLKEDIRPVTDAAQRLLSLKPVNFSWKADGSRVDGFIAHEVQEVIPEAVTGTKDAVETVEVKDDAGNVIGQEERPVYQGIDQSKLVPLLTAALQEALTEISSLKTRIAALEAA